MDPMASALFSHFTSAALVVYIIQFLKKTKYFPWLQVEGQVILKRGFSIFGALVSNTGMAYTWHAAPTGGSHILTLTIPPLAVMAVALWRFAGQFILQEGWYKVVYNKIALPGVPNPLPAPEPKP
jgi:hypothetical protein